MSAHTPGPWSFEYENAEYSGGGCWYSLRGPDGGDLFWYPYNGPRSGGEREEANARLAAAAPKMLSALEAAERRLARVDGFDGTKEIIREAIAKATQP